jgi:hypothetical protein
MAEQSPVTLPQVSIQNGTVHNGLELKKGGKFQWMNPTNQPVDITDCEGFCVLSSYPVPAWTQAGGNGLKEAQLLANPTSLSFTETPNEWNAPGKPHIQTPTMPTAHEREVA